ncbi:MAG: ribosome silencing factor [Deltaproteobacteria bacterium]|uniref:Ribosomal silencing factor RsfS n=1 Tax=Candidatus Zymogenus saltonus TaxID=2844893 RepID=A0A9D8KBP2_9DELT|nr:ribosome silencing factor [Candidatus Zymogenus saltonus]
MVRAASERKVKNLIVMDVKGVSSFSDYIIIMSGTSDRQVIRSAEHIKETLSKEKIYPLGIEGMREGHWVLMDYGDVIAHLFLEDTRLFYDLEGLWPDVPVHRYNEEGKEV